MITSPTPNGSNGRGERGRFARGNAGGPGNPHAKRVARLRAALLKAVKPADLRDVVCALLSAAKAGDVPAARELTQRLLGPADALDVLARLEDIEQRLSGMQNRGAI